MVILEDNLILEHLILEDQHLSKLTLGRKFGNLEEE